MTLGFKFAALFAAIGTATMTAFVPVYAAPLLLDITLL